MRIHTVAHPRVCGEKVDAIPIPTQMATPAQELATPCVDTGIQPDVDHGKDGVHDHRVGVQSNGVGRPKPGPRSED